MTKNNTTQKLLNIFFALAIAILAFAQFSGEEQEQKQVQENDFVDKFIVRDNESGVILDEYHIDDFDSFVDKYQQDYEQDRITIIVFYTRLGPNNKAVIKKLSEADLYYRYFPIEDYR